MRSQCPPPPPAGRVFVDVVGDEGAGCVPYVEQAWRHDGRVRLAVLLADGRDATACLNASDWDWLGWRTGDIVPVRLRVAA